MLSAHAVASPHQAASYFDKDDYYRSGSLGPSAWFGEGAQTLGLYGEVDRQTFQNLLSGHLPDGTQLGTITAGELNHKPGMDLTFSAPKSVSIMAEAVGDTRLIDAHDGAVRETLKLIEAQSLYTRVREDGDVKHIRTGNMTAALFRHDLNRNNDPDLHTHAVGINATQTPDGKWRSVEWRPTLQQVKDFGKIYRTVLAAEVVKLGYEIEIGRDATFELACVPTELIGRLSSRSAQIEDRLEAQGLTRETATTGQKARATLQTRSAKTTVDRDQIATHWQQQIGSAFIALEQAADHAKTKAQTSTAELSGLTSSSATHLVAETIGQLSERQAAFSHAQLRMLVMEYGLGAMSPLQVDTTIQAFVDHGKLLPKEISLVSFLTKRDEVQSGYTTPEAIRTEARMLGLAEKGKNAVRPLVSENSARSAVAAAEVVSAKMGFKWNGEQRQATIGALLSTDRISAIQGRAGTTKTTTVLATVIGVARAKGHKIIGLAPTASAAATLGKAIGSEAMTVHRFVGTAAKQQLQPNAFSKIKSFFIGKRESLWIVDEASMLGTTKMTELLALADQYQARVILTGDFGQISSVEAGRAFEQILGTGVNTQRLDNIQRQTTATGREAVNAAIRRDAAAALALLQRDNGRVIERPNLDQRIAEITRIYTSLPQEERERTLIIDPSREGSEAIKQSVRQALLASGELQKETSVHGTRLVDKSLTDAEKRRTRFYERGDVLRFSRNQTAGDQKIGSSEYLTVVSTTGRSLTLERADGSQFGWTPPKTTRDVTVFQQFAGDLSVGDRIRWTRNEAKSTLKAASQVRGLTRGDLGTVGKITRDTVEIHLDAGRTISIDPSKRADQHYDYGYVSTAVSAQGRTVDRTIFHAEGRRINLVNERSFYVGISRHRDTAIIVTDNRQSLVEGIENRSGTNTSALEIQNVAGAAEQTIRNEVNLFQASPVVSPVPAPTIKPETERVLQIELEL